MAIPAETTPTVGRLQSQSQSQSPSRLASSSNSSQGFLGGVISGAENLANTAWGGLKNAWSTFTYWESRPSQAIETGIGKAIGLPAAQNVSPLKVLLGQQKTDISGQDLAAQVATNLGKDPTSWQFKIGTTVAGLGIDLATDPFMYLDGVGLLGKVGEVTDEAGKSLGVLSDAGLDAVKEFAGEKDLTKVAPSVLESAKASIATRFTAGETDLLDERGLKFAGQTILSGDRIDATIANIKNSAAADWIKNSTMFDKVQSMFNPRWVSGVGQLPDGYFNDKLDTFVAQGASINANAAKDASAFVGGSITPEDDLALHTLANETEKITGVPASGLEGLSPAELRKYIPAEVGGVKFSDTAVSHYAKYLSEFRPYYDQMYLDSGGDASKMIDSYIKNVYDTTDMNSRFSDVPRPIKRLRASYMKGRIGDEEFVSGFLKATGSGDEDIAKQISDLKAADEANAGSTSLHDTAQKLRVNYGLQQSGVLSMAEEAASKNKYKNLVDFIDRTTAQYGTKIDPEDAKAYEKAGYGLYTPKTFFTNRDASEIYAFENKAVATDLNSIFTKTPDSVMGKTARATSARLVNLYFFNPLTAFYHSVFNVGFNSWLSGGSNAFDNLTKGVMDVRDETDLYQLAKDTGAIRPRNSFSTVAEELSQRLGDPADASKPFYEALNPFGRENIGNKLFYQSDEAMRMNLFRNALDKGAAPKDAAAFVNKFAGNWKDMTSAEKSSFQLMYPYYSWFKTNVKANFASWLTNPDRQLLPIKTWNALNEAFSGVPMWENATGAGWKINTGQKDAQGNYIYVTPANAGNIVPELVQSPLQGLAARLLSGPIPEAASTALTGKDVYSNIYGISTPGSDSGAPFTSRAQTVFENLVAPGSGSIADSISSQNQMKSMIQVVTGWDITHPLWENVINTLFQSYSGSVESTWIQNYYQQKSKQKYLTDMKRAQAKAQAK